MLTELDEEYEVEGWGFGMSASVLTALRAR
jgi:hypothetical protein